MKLRVFKKGSLVNDLFCAFKAAAIKSGDKQNLQMLSATLLYARLSVWRYKRGKESLKTFWQVCAK